jgi:hypothetical protein
MKTRINFVRSILAGLFAGIIAAAANFSYVFFYRSLTDGSSRNASISPVSIFVVLPILLLFAGALYFSINRYLKNGNVWYIVFITLITGLAIVTNLFAPGKVSLSGHKGLLLGIDVITGIICIFLLPYLARYSKLFMAQQRMRYRR